MRLHLLVGPIVRVVRGQYYIYCMSGKNRTSACTHFPHCTTAISAKSAHFMIVKVATVPFPRLWPIIVVTCKILARGLKEAATLGWCCGLDSYFVAPSPTGLIHFIMSVQVVDAVA